MELLERIKEITGSDFISDLVHYRWITFYQFHRINEININDYSLKEWNEAAQYISHENKKFDNSRDARDYICTVLCMRRVA
ncbi:MAG: hypothetical protein Q4Q31_09845 [Bacillota bacterium]|nr:hypothetical protein [Bacillota bacterium]